MSELVSMPAFEKKLTRCWACEKRINSAVQIKVQVDGGKAEKHYLCRSCFVKLVGESQA